MSEHMAQSLPVAAVERIENENFTNTFVCYVSSRTFMSLYSPYICGFCLIPSLIHFSSALCEINGILSLLLLDDLMDGNFCLLHYAISKNFWRFKLFDNCFCYSMDVN